MCLAWNHSSKEGQLCIGYTANMSPSLVNSWAVNIVWHCFATKNTLSMLVLVMKSCHSYCSINIKGKMCNVHQGAPHPSFFVCIFFFWEFPNSVKEAVKCPTWLMVSEWYSAWAKELRAEITEGIEWCCNEDAL